MSSQTVRRINLALQGGGAHGAFTWGVLDRLLQDESIEIAGISGTSAGALNGAALKAGLLMGGREAARENLDWLWAQVGAVGDMRMVHWMNALWPLPGIVSQFASDLVPFSMAEAASLVFSPYDYGPFYTNPLRRVAERFHYHHVCHTSGPALHISATNVRTGKIQVFSEAAITADVILASACLPTVFQAVEIKDPKTGRTDAFWDGGYTGNPALFPLFAMGLPPDIVVVNINPLERERIPRTPQEIQDRINEISFNSSLLRELRAIQFVKELIANGKVDRGEMKDVFIHLVADDKLMNELTATTKLLPSADLLFRLKEAGRVAAEVFLERDGAKLNKKSSVDLEKLFS
jgi:NTE family protein